MVIALLGAATVVTGAIAVPRLLRDDVVVGGGVASAGTGTRTGTRIEGLVVYPDDELVPDHSTDDVDYPQTPPVGGPHDPTWLACGVYQSPVRDENAVHDLEHGAVWVTYQPDLASDKVTALAGLLPDNAIMSPYPGLVDATGSSVVLTVWGRQLALDIDDPVDDPRLGQFMTQFGAGEAALEPFVSCEGGSPDPSAGRASNA